VYISVLELTKLSIYR